MKTAIIFVLLLALGGAAYFTRPTKADFQRYLTDQVTQPNNGVVTTAWNQIEADQYLKNCTFIDRYLWETVQENDRTIYTGAFSHWFNRAKISDDLSKVKRQIDSIKIEHK